jgi:hypothetical protein
VTATFTVAALPSYGLTVTPVGTGTVTSTPSGISCGTDCSESYVSGTPVTLTATPATGAGFTGWSGACTGTGSCVVTVDAAKSVTATFNPLSSSAGLVAAYGFNEGTGTTAADASGNGHTGTLSDATWTPGKYGAGLLFNGTSARVAVPQASDLDLTTGFTLAVWVYPTAAPSGWRTLLHKETDRYYLVLSPEQSSPLVGGTFTAGRQHTPGPTALPVNSWSHLAATYDGGTVRLYVNGTVVASQAQTTPLTTSTGPLSIGGSVAYGEFFQGVLDELRLYNRALAAGEIQTVMTTP